MFLGESQKDGWAGRSVYSLEILMMNKGLFLRKKNGLLFIELKRAGGYNKKCPLSL